MNATVKEDWKIKDNKSWISGTIMKSEEIEPIKAYLTALNLAIQEIGRNLGQVETRVRKLEKEK